MRIHEVTVRNFRAIRERVVSFCGKDGLPRKLTVLVAQNMVGKTTILDAIHLAYACIENTAAPKLRPGLDPDDPSLRPDPSRPIEVDIKFSLDDVERKEVAALRTMLGDPAVPDVSSYWLRFRRPGADGKTIQVIGKPDSANQAFRGRALAMLAKTQRRVTEAVFDRVGGVQYLDQHRSVVVRAPSLTTGTEDELFDRGGGEEPMSWLIGASLLDQKWNVQKQGESSWSKVKRLYRELASPAAIEDVVARDEGFDLMLRADGRTYGANGMSSGEQQVLRLVCNLVSRRANRSVVLIDECELHLHPSWQRNLLHYLRTGGGADNQFIVTTHSESILRLTTPEEVVMLAPLEQ